VLRADSVTKSFRLQKEQTPSLRNAFTGFHRARFDTFWAVKGVSVDVERGKMLGVIGSNGSGKSTLLRLMAGIYRPDTGSVTANGRITALIELGAGFEQDLSGRDNIYMNAAILGLTKADVEPVIDEIVEFADIGDFIDNPIKIYSSGMKARLGFAVSAFLEPEILLADEVIAVGDVRFAAKCMARLETMRDSGVTIVLVSHNLNVIERMCDQVLWIEKGVQRMIDEPALVLDAYRDEMDGRSEAAEPGSDPEAPNRITSVVVEPTEHGALIQSGGSIRVRANYDLTDSFDEPEFTVRVVHRMGPCYLRSSSAGQIEMDTISGQGSVQFTIPVLPIPPGQYRLMVALTAKMASGKREVVCGRPGKCPVHEADEDAGGRHVRLPGKWVQTEFGALGEETPPPARTEHPPVSADRG
jgi:ABC-type polysaccharide/polyol phosphate transport system ATPase subunit